SLLSDPKGKLFILKQKKVNPAHIDNLQKTWQRLARSIIPEAFGAYIAHRLQIPFQYVWIIPPTLSYPGKHYDGMPATLHSVLPGKSIRELKREGLFRNIFT